MYKDFQREAQMSFIHVQVKEEYLHLWLLQFLDCKIIKMPLSLIKHQGTQLHEEGENSLQNFDTTRE
jgi:hypothetical protein